MVENGLITIIVDTFKKQINYKKLQKLFRPSAPMTYLFELIKQIDTKINQKKSG